MIEALLAFLFGLLIGSFLNVCIYRLPRDLSVVKPRSFCPYCEKTISWYDNIPLVSYFLLRGRCRHCGGSIPWRYPAVELLTGLCIFTLVYSNGLTPDAIKYCVFAAILIALLFTDLEERILPDEFTIGGTVLGFILAWFIPLDPGIVSFFVEMTGNEADPRVVSLIEAALGALVPSLTLWAIGALYKVVRGREGLGFGDVKMIAFMGSFLGLRSTLLTFFVAAMVGSILGLLFIWLTKKDASTYELPLGSFLAASGLLVALWLKNGFAWFI